MSLQKGWISHHLGAGRRGSCPHWFLCNYYPRELGADELSSSLLRFKSGMAPDCDTWTAYALEVLGSAGAPGAPDTPNFSRAVVLRALHHHETRLTGDEGTSMDVFGAQLARHFGAWYAPWLLAKRRETRAFLEIHTKRERQSELKDVYYWRGKNDTNDCMGKVILLDDIVTTGATVSAILEVVHAALPDAELFVFSLARASPDRTLNEALMRRGAGGSAPG